MAKTVTKKTRKKKAIKLKKKLKREFSLKRKYKTTYKDIRIWFKQFNDTVFEGKLSPFGQVEIKDLAREKCIGQVVTLDWKRKGTRLFRLEMLPDYPEKKYFLDTLVHEMVHLFQMQNKGNSGAHNDMFWSFQDRVENLGLRL